MNIDNVKRPFGTARLTGLALVLLLGCYIGSYIALSWHGKANGIDLGNERVWTFDPSVLSTGEVIVLSTIGATPEQLQRERMMLLVFYPLVYLDSFRGYTHEFVF